MLKIYKIEWDLDEDFCLQKLDLPEHYKVPPQQKQWSIKKIKIYLQKKYFYKIKQLKELE